MVDLEIAVTSPEGACTARDNGADRVELCTGLELGGLTPSEGAVALTVETGIPTFALLRCRPGDFVYDESELRTMEREARCLAAAGVAGVVLGALQADGSLDAAGTRRLVAAARDVAPTVRITFHRAIDHAADPIEVVGGLADLGVDQVLTSGGADTAVDGAAAIARMSEEARGVGIMAGGGLTPSTLEPVIGAGADAVHMSAKLRTERVRRTNVSLGAADSGDSYFVTDAATVRSARAALENVTR
ncbi:copper homeostasis protein CutC [Spelaeicoccus albus]|uniref:PF03932 family protein CutC n=1 Tax=Spelaeicoccus albus TaxID=1280376 RepID=A0A7Z0D082_9MICO|nr:copper homeostasis protein CutC [Spelaeicoccus albus]NYI67076.1 copper homeostasis protein [Spelaeicoccus albus]